MSQLESLKRRISALESCLPEPTPWPPAPGTFGLLLWQDLGKPTERMGFMEMYLASAKKVFSNEA